MNNISITMPERTTVKKIGNSAGIILDKGALKVYNLTIGDEIEIDYKFPRIIIRKIPESGNKIRDTTDRSQ